MIEQIKQEAKKYFINAKPSHDWHHTERVYNLCLQIGKKENADLEILKLAALLHDIGRQYQDQSNGSICHAEKGAIIARQILQNHNLEKEKINQIIYCIESHRFRNNKRPESKEAKILYDADKLDSIGAVGIGRAFSFSGEIGATIHKKDIDIENTKEYSKDDTAYREFLVKLSKIKDKILTNQGKEIAQQRHNFMTNFFKTLNKEVDGESIKEHPLSIAISAVIKDNKILLIKRIRGDYIGLYALPGGKIEKNEHLSNAAVREIQEESGINAKFKSHLGFVSEHLIESNNVIQHFLLHVCELIPKTTEIKNNQEGNLKWFDLDELEKIKSKIVPSDWLMIKKIIINKESNYYDCILEKINNNYFLRKFE